MQSIPGTKLILPEDTVEEMMTGFRRVLDSRRLILGAETERFEHACADAIGTRHAVAVSTGTAALEIAFRALGAAGRSVVLPANTFYATAAAVIRAGARPVLADVGADGLLDSDSVRAVWRDDTWGVVPVHIGGMLPPDLAGIVAHADEHGAVVVEDAAQALGSTGPLGAAGGVGSAGATSFYPTKIATAVEGGVLSTADGDLVRHARVLRDQGKVSFDENLHVAEGYSWRLSELHAVVGTTHLRLLPGIIESKRRIAASYDELLGDSPLRTIPEPVGHRWNRYKYVVVLPAGVDREEVRAGLSKCGVGLSGEVFVRPLHVHPVFAERFGGLRLPNAEQFCARHLCLPISPDLDEADVAHVAASLVAVTTGLLRAG